MHIPKLLTLLFAFVFLFSACKKPQQDSGTIANGSSSQVNQDPLSVSPKYVAYSSESLAKATANDGKALLFFHANWCPTCREAQKEILSRIDEIPENLTILRADYDKETELKKNYQVTYQHTFVQVDSNGDMILDGAGDPIKWSGGGVDFILEYVQ